MQLKLLRLLIILQGYGWEGKSLVQSFLLKSTMKV